MLKTLPIDLRNILTKGTRYVHRILRGRAKILVEQIETAYLELAAILHVVLRDKLYKMWGYNSIEDYAEQELSLRQRKMWYFMRIYQRFILDLKMEPKALSGVGWSKLSRIAKVADDVKTAEMWIEKAKKLSFDELDEKIRKDGRVVMTDDEVFHRVTFSLHPEQYKTVNQALEKAKKKLQTDKPSYALDMICLDFLSTSGETFEEDVTMALKQVERAYGIQILAIKDGQIVYRGKKIQEMLEKGGSHDGQAEKSGDVQAQGK